MEGRKRDALRRYPALGFLAVAAALALLLPSRLNQPRSDPATLAEFAPVPGDAEGRSDLSELGDASSGGLGAGAGVGGGRMQTPVPAGGPRGPGQPGGRTKRCVGDPPRQTEDPLAPPCVPFFDGENGGATARGVGPDEVTAVLWWEGTADAKPDTFVDCLSLPAPGDTPEDTACKAFNRFFNERYQTYKRTVRLWAYHRPTENRSPVPRIDESKAPFAIASVPYTGGDLVATDAAKRGILGAIYMGSGRQRYADGAPYMFGFRNDLEDEAGVAAGYICLKLAGRPARYAGSPVYREQTRVFGILHAGASEAVRLRALDAELDARCNLRIDARAELATSPVPIVQLRDRGVTTVIALGTQANWTPQTRLATQNGWLPEWFLPGDPRPRGADTNRPARVYDQTQWANAFGISFDYRRDAISRQQWYQAYTEGCPTCTGTPSAYSAVIYDTLTMLFYGLQTAGPRLTAANVDRGLHSIPERSSPDAYTPAAYFGRGNYTFVKDAMEIRWDPQGAAPEDPQPGCWLLPNGGRRFRAQEWEAGDASLQAQGAPCQGSMSSEG